MAIWWLSAHDGSINFQCDAKDAGQAFELLARSLRYESFSDLHFDLGYLPGDFQVATVDDQRNGMAYSNEEIMANLAQQREGIVTSAFRHLRRLAGS